MWVRTGDRTVLVAIQLVKHHTGPLLFTQTPVAQPWSNYQTLRCDKVALDERLVSEPTRTEHVCCRLGLAVHCALEREVEDKYRT